MGKIEEKNLDLPGFFPENKLIMANIIYEPFK